MKNYKLFKNYKNKEYEIITEHKIFGTSIIKGNITGLINSDNKMGITIHGKEIFCNTSKAEEKNGAVCLSDDFLKIIIK